MIENSTEIINKIFLESGIAYFDNDFRTILEEIIVELYHSQRELIFKLRLHHIDRAIFKFRQAKEKKHIYNSKQYFKACIISAIKETALDNLEPIESFVE